MAASLRSLLVQADKLKAPPPSRRDAIVAALLALTTVADIPEGVATWQPATALVGITTAATLIVRRTRPLAVIIIGFGLHFGIGVFAGLADTSAELPFGHLLILAIATYALFRWAGWRDVAIGAVVIGVLEIIGELLTVTADWSALSDLALFCGTAAAIGVAIRYRTATIGLRADQARFAERERIARELHDVVAHHVSAIAIQAEGGRAAATTNPAAAQAVLGRIHDTASRALLELRQVVSVLRDTDDDGELAPHAGIAQLADLATAEGEIPAIEVEVRGDADALPAGLGAAVYRIAQEAVTNVRRHADNAQSVSITLTVETDTLTLLITDDGRSSTNRGAGYGLIGMDERATLLGGSFAAGPRTEGVGWHVQTTIPLNGEAT